MKNESITLNVDLATKIKATNPKNSFRGNALLIIERYFEIVKSGRREVRRTFSDNELMLLADICNGTMFDPFSLILENNGVLIQYQDTTDIYGNHYHEKWTVEDLTGKLVNLSNVGQIGLITLIEEFWAGGFQTVADVFKK